MFQMKKICYNALCRLQWYLHEYLEDILTISFEVSSYYRSIDSHFSAILSIQKVTSIDAINYIQIRFSKTNEVMRVLSFNAALNTNALLFVKK